MAINGSHRTARVGPAHDHGEKYWISVPLFPALLGVLAVLNIASVIMVLIE